MENEKVLLSRFFCNLSAGRASIRERPAAWRDEVVYMQGGGVPSLIACGVMRPENTIFPCWETTP